MLMTSTYDSARAAFLLVDPYNDFFAENGKIYPRLRDVAESVGLHQHIGELLSAARATGMQVAIAPHRRYRTGDLAGWLRPAPTQQRLREYELYAADTIGGDWYPDFAPQAGDIVATEHWGMSGFAHTDLDQQLRQHGIEHVILAGLTAPGCVEGTGRWGMELGYAVTLVKDATASFTKEWLHAAVELNGPLYAEVLTTAEVLTQLKN